MFSGCHLSLDRSFVFTDDACGGIPYVLLHIHGMRAGALQAVAMVTQILQRHVTALQAPPPVGCARKPAALPAPVAEAVEEEEEAAVEAAAEAAADAAAAAREDALSRELFGLEAAAAPQQQAEQKAADKALPLPLPKLPATLVRPSRVHARAVRARVR